MKKLLMAAFLLLGMVAVSRAAEETLPIVTSVYISTTSAPASLVFSGAGTVYGIMLSSGVATNYCVMRDSGTVNTTSTELLPRQNFIVANGQMITFPKPIRITNGLEANVGATTANEACAVFYRKGKLY